MSSMTTISKERGKENMEKPILGKDQVVCCLCGAIISKNDSNNVSPLKIKGVCCGECNNSIVIPIRFYLANAPMYKNMISIIKKTAELLSLIDNVNFISQLHTVPLYSMESGLFNDEEKERIICLLDELRKEIL